MEGGSYKRQQLERSCRGGILGKEEMITLSVSKSLARNTNILSWTVTDIPLTDLGVGNASRFRVYRSCSPIDGFELISVDRVDDVSIMRSGEKDRIDDRYIVDVLFIGLSPGRRDFRKGVDYELVKEEAKNFIRWKSEGPPIGTTYYATYTKEKEIGTTTFVDDTALEIMALDWFYKVSLVDFSGEEAQISNIATVEMRPLQKWITAMQEERLRRLYQSLLLVGEEVRYFKRKIAGTLCQCVSQFSELADQNINCPICYDTRFVGGFDEMKMLIVDSKERRTPLMRFYKIGRVLEWALWAKVELSSPNVWSVNVPPFFAGDLLVRSNNERYIVKNSYENHVAGYVHKCEAELDFLPSPNILYDVGVK